MAILLNTYAAMPPYQGESRAACLNLKTYHVGVFNLTSCHLTSLSEFWRERLPFVAISFYALLLLVGPCRLS